MNYRYGVITAVTWRLVAEFIRRHKDKSDFNIMELHPCSGMYDCLSIFIKENELPGRQLFDFNQVSGNLHIFGAWDQPRKRIEELNWPDKNNYVSAFLCANDTSEILDDMDDLVGMTSFDYKALSNMTSKVLMIRIIANLLQRHALGRQVIDVRSALNDNSWGAHIREEVKKFTKVYEQMPQDACYQDMARAALDFWIIKVGNAENIYNGKVKAVIDLRGEIYFEDKPEVYWNVWKEYKEGKSIGAIVSKLDKFIMS